MQAFRLALQRQLRILNTFKIEQPQPDNSTMSKIEFGKTKDTHLIKTKQFGHLDCRPQTVCAANYNNLPSL